MSGWERERAVVNTPHGSSGRRRTTPDTSVQHTENILGSRIALVHDWLTGMRGGEQCLEVLCRMFPEAEIFTLRHCKGSVSGSIESHSIHTSFLQSIPSFHRGYRYLLPLFPLAIEGFDLHDRSLIISISHCVAKGVIPGPNAMHLCYCLSPMRYIWDKYSVYFLNDAFPVVPPRLAHIISHYLRIWDVASAQRVDRFAAVSNFVASRIWKYYRRRADVLYPPVECSRFSVSTTGKKDYYLLVGADAPYKRVDLAIETFGKIGRPLHIVGTISARDREKCRSLKSARISCLGWVSDEELTRLYAECRAVIFPGEEDFGLVPLEAQASGRPVIAYGKGGARESVKGIWTSQIHAMTRTFRKNAYTGIFFDAPTAASLAAAVEAFEAMEDWFDPEETRRWAQQFDRSVFEKKFLNLLNKVNGSSLHLPPRQ